MENPGGIPLQQWLDERPSPVSAETAHNMLQPVFDGVAAMHQVGWCTAASARRTSGCWKTAGHA